MSEIKVGSPVRTPRKELGGQMSLRSESKREFGTLGIQPTHEEIRGGCLQRIADATEVMAQNWVRITSDLEYQTKEARRLREIRDKRDKTIIGLRGQIGKLMKRIRDLEAAK